MIVGEDVAVGRDDETGPATLAEAVVVGLRNERKAGLLVPGLGALRLDEHDAGRDRLGHGREGVAVVGQAGGAGDVGCRHRLDGGAGAGNLLGHAPGGEVEQAGEKEAERKGERYQAAELEPIE